MKNLLLIIIWSLLNLPIYSQNSTPETNDFYDNDSTYVLGSPTIKIEGEIQNPGIINLSILPLRSEIVKEAILNDDDSSKFIGAYRYDGYSLYDILNNIILKKKNEAEFNPIIDLYVEVENDKGEQVKISWGEIYYPINRHKILLATQVARIVPSKTKDLWPLPTENKLIIGTDLFTERNISNPTKITIKSYAASILVNRDLVDTYAKEFSILKNEKILDIISAYPENLKKEDYATVFYGRGRGIHGITTFKGVPLKNVLFNYVQWNKKNIQNGLVVFVGKDGYRCVFTYSELFNRNDFAETLLINRINDTEKGAFSIFCASDYFSDRAVKMLTEIRLIE